MPFTARTPLDRKRSTPFSFNNQPIHSLSFCCTTSPTTSIPIDETRESCECSWLSSKNLSSLSTILSKENARMPKMKSISISLFVVRLIGTPALIARMRFSTSTRSSSDSTRSHLLSKMRSAKAICSTASFSTPSGFSSSRCWTMCFASTRVKIPSRRMCCCTKSSAKKVCATGAGSAKPVVSIKTPSKGLLCFFAFLMSFFNPAIKSPRTVQQMQPLFISTIFSSSAIDPPFTRASSMPTSPNSFSMTAILLP
mmetsp:Transcript_86847/g.137044  ORF Transcript_86847/g.137044 Transcript_86847/m.137044 type:complete len:254 (+) Transcript_86847:350-1111(+)